MKLYFEGMTSSGYEDFDSDQFEYLDNSDQVDKKEIYSIVKAESKEFTVHDGLIEFQFLGDARYARSILKQYYRRINIYTKHNGEHTYFVVDFFIPKDEYPEYPTDKDTIEKIFRYSRDRYLKNSK